MASAFVLGVEPDVHHAVREVRRGGAAAEGQHVGVVVALCEFRHVFVGAERAADAFDFVCGDRDADACAAAYDAEIRLSVRHSVGAFMAENGVVHGGCAVGAQVQDFDISVLCEVLLDGFLEFEAAVIARECYFRGLILSASGLPQGVPSAFCAIFRLYGIRLT